MFESVAKYGVAIVAVQSAVWSADFQKWTDGPPWRSRCSDFFSIGSILRQIERHVSGFSTCTCHDVFTTWSLYD